MSTTKLIKSPGKALCVSQYTAVVVSVTTIEIKLRVERTGAAKTEKGLKQK